MDMNRKTLFILLGSLFVVMVFLLGCTADAGNMAATDIPMVSPSPTSTPVPTEIPVSVEGFVPINKDNFRDIELIAELGTGRLYDTVVSPDGLTFATVTASGITLYDMETFEEIHHQEHYIYPEAPLAYSPDGEYLIYTTHSVIYQIEIDSWEFTNVFSFPGPSSKINMLTYTPEGNRILVQNSYNGSGCEGLEISYSLITLEGHLLFVRNFCGNHAGAFYQFNNNDTTLVSFPYIDPATFPYDLFLIENETGNVLSAAYKRYTGDDREVVETTIGDKSLLPAEEDLKKTFDQLVYRETNKLLLDCNIPHNVPASYSVLYESDSVALIQSQDLNIMTKIDKETCEIIQALQVSTVNNLKFNNKDILAATTNGFNTYVWQLSNGELLIIEKGVILQYPNNLAAFNNDGTYLLTAPYRNPHHGPESDFSQNKVTVIDVENLRNTLTIDFSDKGLHAIYETPFNNIMIIEDSSGSHLWNTETGEMISSLPDGQYISDEIYQRLWVIQKKSNYEYVPCIYDAQSGELFREFEPIRGIDLNARLTFDSSALDLQYRNLDEDLITTRMDAFSGQVILTTIEKYDVFIEHFEDESLSDWTLERRYFNNPSLISVRNKFYTTNILDTNGPFYVSNYLYFWDKKSGAYLGYMGESLNADSVIFSPHDYFMALLGEDGIARIFGVRKK
jgi:WD40 repeat protein